MDIHQFKRACSHFVSGVTVVTALDPICRLTGLTVSSFCSVSLEPPLVLVYLYQKSRTYSAVKNRKKFAVNVLTADQKSVASEFATSRTDKWNITAWGLGGEVPYLSDAEAVFHCDLFAEHDASDHKIVLGKVREIMLASGAPDPLVYHRSRLFSLEDQRPVQMAVESRATGT